MLRNARKGAIPLFGVLKLAQEVGIEESKWGGKTTSIEQKVLDILSGMTEIAELLDPQDPNPQSPTPYFVLNKFLEEKGKPVTQLYPYLVTVIQSQNPKFTLRLARSQAGFIINALQENNILTVGELESRIKDFTLSRMPRFGSVEQGSTRRVNYVSEAYSQSEAGVQLTTKNLLQYPARPEPDAKRLGLVNYAKFRAFVARSDFEQSAFLNQITALRGAVSEPEAFRRARSVGIKSSPGKSIEKKVSQILREAGYVQLADPDPDKLKLQAPIPYWGLKKYEGRGWEPIRNVVYGAFEQAVKELRPDFAQNQKAVHQNVGAIIGILVQNGIGRWGDLEERLKSDGLEWLKLYRDSLAKTVIREHCTATL